MEHPGGCPVPAAHDKYTEAHYFIERMLDTYHEPDPFRWNLNAFLQALRNVTFMLQSEQSSSPGFEEWYQGQQAIMSGDPILRKCAEGRIIVVHKGMLLARSTAKIGLFRGRKPQLVMERELSPEIPSRIALQHGIESFVGTFIDAAHSAIDEQVGIRRVWLVDELGSGEVVGLCDQAFASIGRVVKDAHRFAAAKSDSRPLPPFLAYSSPLHAKLEPVYSSYAL